MRGKIVRFSYLTRQRQTPAVEAENTKPNSKPKNLLFRLWDKTAAPFWFARMRRRMRPHYRESVALQMQAVSQMVYRVEVRGSENFTHSPSTIIACGHKRDTDIPIIIPRLYLFQKPRSRRKEFQLLYAAARDDVFERGFLTVYFPLLNFLRPLLSRLSLSRWFQILQACPVKLPDEQTVNQLLNETLRVEGNLPAPDSLDETWRERLLGDAANQPGLTLKDVILRAPLKELTQYATPRMFREPLATRIRQRHHATMHAQLRYLIRVLEKGGSLIVLPEGRITPDGRFCKMRAAVIRLIQQARVETSLLPLNLTYDFMDTERANVTMIIGPEVTKLKHYSKSELADTIRRKVAGLVCVSMSGLVSRALVEAVNRGANQIKLSRFKEEIWAEAQRLRSLGLALDRQLATRQEFEERFERFLNYAWHTGGFFLVGPMFAADSSKGHDWLRLDRPSLLREECTKHSDNPVRYCYNELTELLETWDALPQAEPEVEVSPLDLAEVRTAHRLTAG
jgi:1-acyl-sn-glycerol-3-phosphate acyltransferase